VRLSVVVPAFREDGRIGHTVACIRSELAGVAADGGLEVIVVDDGSDDGTSAAARAAGADQVVTCRVNRGKGAAVRAGFLAARGATVAFTDADLAYAPAQLSGLLDQVESGFDVAVGNRRHEETMTVVDAGWLREAGSVAVNWLTKLVLKGRYQDTQCGLKAMRSDVGRLVFSRTVVDGFAFDVELFHLAELYRLSLVEVPVEVVNSSHSTVNVARDATRLVQDLVRVRLADWRGVYDVPAGQLPPVS
jgi:glycosyltransferase involved in cell wall biosynthesis